MWAAGPDSSWAKRYAPGRPRPAYSTGGLYRYGMLGRFIGLAHLLAKFARIDLAALLNGRTDAPERIQALDRLDQLFHSPLARLTTGTPALLFSLGIPPQQRAPAGSRRSAQRSASPPVVAPDQRSPQRNELFCLAGAASGLPLTRRSLSAALSAAQPV